MMQKLLVLLLLCVLTASSAWANQDQLVETDSCDAYSGTKVPKFRVAQTNVNRADKFTGLIISIAPRDADKNKIIALACKLGRDYAKDRVLVLWILDNHHAAKQFRVGNSPPAISRAVRASYSFDREKNSQDLTWTPDRNNPSSSINITLGPPPPVP